MTNPMPQSFPGGANALVCRPCRYIQPLNKVRDTSCPHCHGWLVETVIYHRLRPGPQADANRAEFDRVMRESTARVSEAFPDVNGEENASPANGES